MNFKKLGPYDIGQQLGRGGMGTVFEGTNEETGERVAVKVLSQSLATDEGFRERFEQEIETLRKLRHENIVRLFGFGEQDGTLFYVMELVDGTSLEQELRLGRKFDWEEATKIAVQMCRGLKHAHDRGVIHRDIKPANLMLTPEGEIKISDFGIAKLFGSSGMTMAGGVIGTAEFMAPEQADGRPVSHRSDLYSLGGVLYALIAGRPPFVSKSIVDVLQMQRFSKPEPLRRHNADVPREFDDIIMQLLAKDPQERIANSALLMRRLESTERGLTKRRTLKGDDHDFDLTPNAAPMGDPGATSQVDVTRVETGRGSQADSVDLMAPTRQTGSEDIAATQASVVAGNANASSVTPVTHYTTVAEDDLGEDLLTSDDATRNWPQITLLASALIAVIGLVWWFMQPPTAEDLSATIDTALQADPEEGHASVEKEIREFLDRFPNHEEAARILGYQKKLDQHSISREYRKTLRKKNSEELTTVQRIFLSATDRRISPTQSREQLTALVVILNATEEDDQDQECLEAAKEEIGAISDLAKAYQQREEDFIVRNLARAENLVRDGSEEAISQAQGLLHSIVTLYADESWAEPHLKSAQGTLRRLAETDDQDRP